MEIDKLPMLTNDNSDLEVESTKCLLNWNHCKIKKKKELQSIFWIELHDQKEFFAYIKVLPD